MFYLILFFLSIYFSLSYDSKNSKVIYFISWYLFDVCIVQGYVGSGTMKVG